MFLRNSSVLYLKLLYWSYKFNNFQFFWNFKTIIGWQNRPYVLDTYEEGMEKLHTVRNDDRCLFTADFDFDLTEKAAHITKKFKECKKQRDLPQLPEFEDIPSLSSVVQTLLEQIENSNLLLNRKQFNAITQHN